MAAVHRLAGYRWVPVPQPLPSSACLAWLSSHGRRSLTAPWAQLGLFNLQTGFTWSLVGLGGGRSVTTRLGSFWVAALINQQPACSKGFFFLSFPFFSLCLLGALVWRWGGLGPTACGSLGCSARTFYPSQHCQAGKGTATSCLCSPIPGLGAAAQSRVLPWGGLQSGSVPALSFPYVMSQMKDDVIT